MNIPTWRERAEAHPGHQTGMVSEGMIEARMCEEIEDLRAENERLRAEKEALYASIAGIERAAAGAIYSQESIHAMALYALKPLMERGIEPAEAKP